MKELKIENDSRLLIIDESKKKETISLDADRFYDDKGYCDEMISAIEAAREIGASIKLIDKCPMTLVKIDQDAMASSQLIESARRDFKL
jgi:hypothetical protein